MTDTFEALGVPAPIVKQLTDRGIDSPFPIQVATIPDSTKTSLQHRLTRHAAARWPALTGVRLRYRAGFAYVDGVLADGESLRLCRLRYAGQSISGCRGIWGCCNCRIR